MNLALAKKKMPQTREEMLEQTIEDIRGKFGQGSIMRLGDNARANVEVIPSGILPLNIALGIGGYLVRNAPPPLLPLRLLRDLLLRDNFLTAVAIVLGFLIIVGMVWIVRKRNFDSG